MSEAPIRLLCVDDHPLLREGIAAILGNQPDLLLVAQAGSGREALERFREHRPDVTLMDLRLPGMNLGPGALSVDARWFGRRQLRIPPSSQAARRE